MHTITDNTTIVSIESIFENQKKDPWALENAGYFADLYIWSDRIQYILPIPNNSQEPYVPKMISKLSVYDSKIISAKKYFCENSPVLKQEYLERTFEAFLQFIHCNKSSFTAWSEMHHEEKILREHQSWIGRRYFYDLKGLKELACFKNAVSENSFCADELLYAFDVSLRYPFYGEFVEDNGYYLTHQIRKGIQFPELERTDAKPPHIPLSFKRMVMEIARHMTFDEFIVFLHEARYLIREKERIHQYTPGIIDEDYIAKIARELQLPPKLNNLVKVSVGAGAGIISTLGFFSLLGPAAFIAGIGAAICPIIWDRPLPRTFSKIRWLNWAYHWDLGEHK